MRWIIEQVNDKPLLSPTKLAKVLSTPIVDRCFRCISGATNISVFELNQLALPDPLVLRKTMSKGGLLDNAMLEAHELMDEN
jgi:adenine-specific DNA-methyltransferase